MRIDSKIHPNKKTKTISIISRILQPKTSVVNETYAKMFTRSFLISCHVLNTIFIYFKDIFKNVCKSSSRIYIKHVTL